MKIDYSSIEGKFPKIYKNKKLILAGLLGGGFLIIATFAIFLQEDGGVSEKIASAKKEINISNVTRKVRADDVWLEKAEGQLIELNKNVELLTRENKRLSEEIKEKEQKAEDRIKKLEDKEKQIEGKIVEITTGMDDKSSGKQDPSLHQTEAKAVDNVSNLQLSSELEGHIADIDKKIISHDIVLEGGLNSNNHSKNLDLYLPAGSYVDAELISGVDASVGVESQSDPRPVLFRVLGNAITAINKTKEQKVNLSGCTVIGAASGDLSSERVFVRLLKMSCSREDNKVFETEIEGYVSSKGKAGIRGDVVSREGDFVNKSFMAGLIGGIGGGISQKFTRPDAIFQQAGADGAGKMSTKDIFGKGIGKGTEMASNKVSDYLIKRAEQYQPVVSVGSGQNVELVFNNGVYLDGRK
jgi:conjugal transfer pilus assembly protein TraB